MRRSEVVTLTDGLLTDVPPTLVPNGAILGGYNYEVGVVGGYRRIDGFERVDDRRLTSGSFIYHAWKPSNPRWRKYSFDTGTAEIFAGDTITGVTSGATAYVVSVTLSSGSWGGGDAAGDIVATRYAATDFTTNETLQVSAANKARYTGSTQHNDATYMLASNWTTHRNAVAEALRDTVLEVTTDDVDVFAGWQYGGALYAIADNTATTGAELYKAASGAWSKQTLGDYIYFSGGSAVFTIGSTITGATSGATGVVRKILLHSGDWGTTNAAGTLLLTGVSGTFQSESISGGGGAAVADGPQTANLIPRLNLGGKIETHSPDGTANGRMYIAARVNATYIAEWDGTYLTPVGAATSALNFTNGATTFAWHGERLFVGTSLGKVVFTAVGDPYEWRSTQGAGEILVGDEVVELVAMTSDVLVIFCTERILALYGTDSSTWELKVITAESGALHNSVQRMGNRIIYANPHGIKFLETTERFGDFIGGSITNGWHGFYERMIDPEQASSTGTFPIIGSLVVPERNQYRLYFASVISDDGEQTRVLTITFIGDRIAMIPAFLPVRIYVPTRAETKASNIISQPARYFCGRDHSMVKSGHDSGSWLLEMTGPNFDGVAISAFLRVMCGSQGSPEQLKHYREATLTGRSNESISLSVTPVFGYSDDEYPDGTTQTVTMAPATSDWERGVWDSGVTLSDREDYAFIPKNSRPTVPAEVDIAGDGTNLALDIQSAAGLYEKPHSIDAIWISFSPRGQSRRK